LREFFFFFESFEFYFAAFEPFSLLLFSTLFCIDAFLIGVRTATT